MPLDGAGVASGAHEEPQEEAPQPELIEPNELGPRHRTYLDVPGFLPAPLFAPDALDRKLAERLRVLVIAHGAGGRGEHHCEFWEPLIPPDVVLACPQGALLRRGDPDGGAYFPDHLKLREELRALSTELEAHFGQAIEERGWRYMGYSQGATMGALAVVGELPIFTELVLIEGGGENWTKQRALDFKSSGGERVILACGTQGCARHGARSEGVLKSIGLDAAFVEAPGVGHTYGGEVARVTHEKMMEWEGR